MLPIIRTRKTYPSVFHHLFDDDFFNASALEGRNIAKPAVNIKETETEFQIDVAAPGLDKKDFNVEIENDLLTISSTKEESNEENLDHYSCKEFNYAQFSRSFSLPESIDAEKIKASHKNGVLSIHLPKKDESKLKKVKQINIA